MNDGFRPGGADAHALCSKITAPILNKTIKAHVQRLRWEWGGLSPFVPCQGRADCLWLKAASTYRPSPRMSDACWQIITGGSTKRQSVDWGELQYYSWCTHSQNVRPRAQRLAVYTNNCSPGTQCRLSHILRINSDRCQLSWSMNSSTNYYTDYGKPKEVVDIWETCLFAIWQLKPLVLCGVEILHSQVTVSLTSHKGKVKT